MRRLLWRTALAALALNIVPDALADNGALLASQCYQCHGPNGRSKGDIDSLTGESASEIYNEMREMQRDTEVDIMHAQAKMYTDAELQAISSYLSTLR